MREDETISLRQTDSLGQTETTPSSGRESKGVDVDVPRQLGPVRLVREIGRGGLGVVFLGHHEILDRDVAVKFVCVAGSGGDTHKRFLDEARAAARVRHSALVPIHNADIAAGVPFIVMELIDGLALSELSRVVGPLEVAATLAVMEAVCPAVSALHEQGLVHRDIKPANIFVGNDGAVFLGDFGLTGARRRRVDGDEGACWAGTPAYMAPEMFEGEASPRSDVFALGATVYQLLAGELCFGGTIEEIRERHEARSLKVQPLLDRGVDQAIVEVIERAMHPDPVFRYKSAESFFRALRDASKTSACASDHNTVLAGLVARMRLRHGESDAPDTAGRSCASYFDQISDMAEAKRGDGGAEGQETDVRSPVNDGIGDCEQAYLAVDLDCLGCGYNIRGLDCRGNCPECGRPVEESTKPDRLVFADSAWMQRVRNGMLWIIVSVAALIASVGFLYLVGRLYDKPGLTGGLARAESVVVAGTRIVSWLCAFVGVFLATSIEPGSHDDEKTRQYSQVARVCFFLVSVSWLSAAVSGAGELWKWNHRMAIMVPYLNIMLVLATAFCVFACVRVYLLRANEKGLVRFFGYVLVYFVALFSATTLVILIEVPAGWQLWIWDSGWRLAAQAIKSVGALAGLLAPFVVLVCMARARSAFLRCVHNRVDRNSMFGEGRL